MSLTGLKDVDREVLKHVDDDKLLRVCTIDRKTWNDVCDDNFLRRRLVIKYPGIEQYKLENETWKQFFLRFIYYISLMKEKHQFEYTGGNFKKQHELLENFRDIDQLITKAIEEGELSLVKFVLERSKQTGKKIEERNLLLGYATRYRQPEIVKYLIEQGFDIHLSYDYILTMASREGYLEIVKLLVENGANIHADNDYALLNASMNGHLDVVKYLVEHGSNVAAGNYEALRLAKRYRHKEVEDYLENQAKLIN